MPLRKTPIIDIDLSYRDETFLYVDLSRTFYVPTLPDVVALSANDAWVVGRAFSWIDLRMVPMALHWNGQTAAPRPEGPA